MERTGRLYRVKGHRYAVPDAIDLVVGRLAVTQRGDAFLRPEAGPGGVFVPARELAGAMDGDKVVVRIESRPPGRSPTGRVIRVLERARATVVGTFHRARRFQHVTPLDRRLTQDVMIPDGEAGAAEDGDVVVVDFLSFGDGATPPVGTVQEVLGRLSDPGVDILAIVHGYGLSLDFPAAVLKEAEEAARSRSAEPGPDRLDRTDLLVVTIDPVDAKDHDDALSLTRTEEGWELGVHIADVSHFVEEGGPLDLEARNRGTSVYLVDRVLPMLPEQLSGDACSLREGLDRFAVSVFLRMDATGAVLDRRFERTTVRSRRRLAYEEVQDVLEGRRSLGEEVDALLRGLDDLARAVRRRRHDRGALDLDLPEARVLLDDEGVPVDIQRVERLESHRLVEDFMILANEAVATELEARDVPALFRVHEPPVREKVEELGIFLRQAGLRMPRRRTLKPQDLQELLEAVRGRPDEALVANVVLRSLQRARYAPQNLGHFGLASDAYLHFTSPIRRYPDLVVHRAVTRALIHGLGVGERDEEDLAALADLCSERERSAEAAERDSVALKKVEFMERHLGEEFTGRISGVTAFGFFVTLDAFFVDGLVHVNSLRDDYYHFEEGGYALVGDRGRRTYRLGDDVVVQVARVDKEARHVDFLLLRKLSPRGV